MIGTTHGAWSRLRSSAIQAALLLFALSCATAFGSFSDGARSQFASDNSCPADRVTASLRPDIPAHALRRREAPPPEVAADRERLAYFNAQQAKLDQEIDDEGYEVFEVHGCGQRSRLACRRPVEGHVSYRVHCRTIETGHDTPTSAP
jgi:hypothetical protein